MHVGLEGMMQVGHPDIKVLREVSERVASAAAIGLAMVPKRAALRALVNRLAQRFVHPFGGMSAYARYPVRVAL